MAQDIQKDWPLRHGLAMIDGEAIKDKRKIRPSQLQMLILRQLHNNHMGIEKIRLPACESVYWVNMNIDIENTIEHCPTCLEYQKMQLQEKTIPHMVLTKLWDMVGADIFMVNNETLFCIVD